VVDLRMGGHEQVEPAHTLVVQAREDRPVRRTRVDEDGMAAVLDQRRVALAHVEERDPQARRGGRRPGAEPES
jgi:hypothetical protein